ncbi:hypothetical protein MLD38_012922 [Melastoma candidum]|uniref:Uncharacterized protein n=1 Tax=Melastoma candidum TaxID=119954 RepID=A0ACB9R7W4_9MYRT|nr:hypothetical protein MLD38_012922 [Melastoma candidum]
MESDGEDFGLFALVEANSPPVRQLKRLKKAIDVVAVKSPPHPSDAGYDPLGEYEGPSLDLQPEEPDDGGGDSGFCRESVGVKEDGLGFEDGEGGCEDSGVGVKRALDFDSSDEGGSERPGDCENGEEGSEDEFGVGDDGGKVDAGDVGDDLKRRKKKKKEKKERKKSRVERSGEFGVGSVDDDYAEGDAYSVPKRVSEKVKFPLFCAHRI